MLFALISPAKKLDFGPLPEDIAAAGVKATAPALLKDTAELAARTKKLSRSDLRRLMDLSASLAELNYERFQSFDPANKGETKPAIYAFAGDVYMGFKAHRLSAADIAFAQDHVGIISGLYGLLRPLDAMQPYRLEMGSRLRNDRGKDLYAFWRETLTAHINSIVSAMDAPTIINLASEEYWDAVDTDKLTAPVVQAVFMEIRGAKTQIISFMAKKARGLMARYIVQHRLSKPDDIKRFDTDGYRFDADASSDIKFVFSRIGK